MGNENLERLLDLIADALIQSDLVNVTAVEGAQKTIRNGIIQGDRTSEERLILYQKDIKANQEDLQQTTELESGEVISELQSIADAVDFVTLSISVVEGTNNSFIISLTGGGTSNDGLDITHLVATDGEFSNVSQFVSLQLSSSLVNVDKANEFLDTNIYELLPTGDTRQARITRFFQELNALLPTNEPEFDEDDVLGVDRDVNGNWIGSEQYSQDNSISYAQNNTDGNIDEEDAFIHRLKLGTIPANSTNSTKTIEDIYNRIEPYLKDILETPATLGDDRPEYRNQSSGYLKFRNLNQGIIIRNTNQDFIEGLNPNNLTYLDTLTESGDVGTSGTGFTISMWVRFLDKVSQGTLFNFANPTREENPFGFKLETYVLNKDDLCPHQDYSTWGDAVVDNNYNTNVFDNSKISRFVRLVVNDNGQLRDSHVGAESLTEASLNFVKLNTVIPFLDYDLMDTPDNGSRLINTTFIPEDFNEWYFINATFNPEVEEENSDFDNTNPDYWLNHIDAGGNYTTNSLLGNKCKVEIISRTDLLRARGFKV